MAWPRIKNSRSSAQPGTHSPDGGVQATVTPAPDAEPRPGTGHNTGVGGTTHAVAFDGGPGTPGPAADPKAGRRLRAIRYGHSAGDRTQPSGGADGADVSGGTHDIPAAARPTLRPVPETPPAAEEDPEVIYPAGVLPPGPGEPDPAGNAQGDYEDSAALGYETSRPADANDEPGYPARDSVANEGLGIFGGVATTEIPEDDGPAEDPGREHDPPPPAAGPAAAPVLNPRIGSSAGVSSEPQERKQHPFDLIRGIRAGGGQPEDDELPRVSVRDLPPDVQMSFIRDRTIIVIVVGVLSYLLVRSWALSVTLVIIAFVLDMVRRQRSAAMYVNGGAHPGARKATSRQLRKMRRDGYFTLDARPIPDSREVIDHLVIGPTGVYAIDSEKWNPRVPVRTWNGKKLYHGPESQKDRLEHAAWEAAQASEILSSALGFEVTVRPALAIYGPRIPWDIATIRNVDVFTGPALGKYLKARKRLKAEVPRLTREEARTIYDAATQVLPDVAGTHTPVG